MCLSGVVYEHYYNMIIKKSGPKSNNHNIIRIWNVRKIIIS